MSNTEVEELKTQFVTQWERTPDHQKMFFITELNKIRESSFQRNCLIENKEPYKLDYQTEKEKYAKANRNAPKWYLGFLFVWAIVDFFNISKLDNQLVTIFGLLILIVMIVSFILLYGLKLQ